MNGPHVFGRRTCPWRPPCRLPAVVAKCRCMVDLKLQVTLPCVPAGFRSGAQARAAGGFGWRPLGSRGIEPLSWTMGAGRGCRCCHIELLGARMLCSCFHVACGLCVPAILDVDQIHSRYESPLHPAIPDADLNHNIINTSLPCTRISLILTVDISLPSPLLSLVFI